MTPLHRPRQRVARVALVAVAVLFAIGTSVLAYDNVRVRDLAPRFHWPDETTNAFFATRVARGQPLAVSEPRNVTSGNLVHPRTTNVRADGAIVPGSYLGLPFWYGMVARVFGERVLGFLTPMLAAGGLLAFVALVLRWAGRSVALLATVLLTLHPSLWFFAATAFLPNVPFAALLLIGCALLIGRAEETPRSQTREVCCGFFGGIAIGLALTIRTHEVLWVAVLVTAMVWRQRLGWRVTTAAALGAVLPLLPMLMLQYQIYGSPFTTGYAVLQEGGALPTEFASSASWVPGWLTAIVAPFGWDVPRAATNAWRYLVVPYPWFWALAIVGLVRGIIAGVGRSAAGAMGTVALVAWLVLYYGSWELADPLVRSTNVLTISYVRYWLPILVVIAPWAAIGLTEMLARISMRWRPYIVAFTILTIAFGSTSRLIGDPAEGLLRQRAALVEHRVRARAVIAATPPHAVIVSDRLDKTFFPERAVIHAPVDALRGRSFRERLAALVSVQEGSVYWYTTGSLDAPTVRIHGPLPGIDVNMPTVKFEERGQAAPFGERLYQVTGVLTGGG